MTDPRTMSLIDADPDLGRLLEGEALEAARRDLVVRLHAIDPGPWDGERLRDAGPEHVGLMIVDGLMTRELALADNVSAELLGRGDILRPWQANSPEQLVPFGVRWAVIEQTRLAVLDQRFCVALARHPEVNAMLIDRLTERTQRLSLMQAISQLNGVDRRLMTLFWHLAERWGRVTRDGVVVSIAVPHRVVAQLVGARRPTVSTALSQLAARGELVRTSEGTWLLSGAPYGVPSEDAARIVRRRRRRFQPAVADAHDAYTTPTGAELHESLIAVRDSNQRYREEFATLKGRTVELLAEMESRRAEWQRRWTSEN
jgi:CRP/FNR family transcriptional regulator, cyclic AMP receptor protein